MMRSVTVTFDLPKELEERLLALGNVEWGHTGPLTDEEHAANLSSSLRLTREHFALGDEPQDMMSVCLAGTEIVVCHTGTSPNSGLHAQLIVGLLNGLRADLVLAQPSASSAA